MDGIELHGMTNDGRRRFGKEGLAYVDGCISGVKIGCCFVCIWAQQAKYLMCVRADRSSLC